MSNPSLQDRLTAATVVRLCAAAVFLIVGIGAGIYYSSLLLGVLFGLVSLAMAGNALVDSDDELWGYKIGGWAELAFDLTILLSAAFLVLSLQGNVHRWNTMGNRKAPAVAEGKLPFADDLYNQIKRPEAGKLTLPRYADGTRWLLRLSDKIVELVPGERDGYKIVEDVDTLVVTGDFPDGTKIYYINIDLVPSVSKDIPKVK